MLTRCTTRRLWPEQDQGPYHRDTHHQRRRIVEDRDGSPLQLGIRLQDVDGRAIVAASVEIWQCDALGRYSGFPPPDSASVITAETAPRTEYLLGQTFLRGSQSTDDAGMVEFETIFPGWYPGRTIHIHLMVHADTQAFTSQLYFPDSLSDRVLTTEPYVQRPHRDTTNTVDEIFPTGGDPAVLDTIRLDVGHRAAASFILPTTRRADS